VFVIYVVQQNVQVSSLRAYFTHKLKALLLKKKKEKKAIGKSQGKSVAN